MYSWDDGWTIERVRTPADLTLEGELMYHCSKDHQLWVSKEVELFFSLRSDVAVPKATVYCKPKALWRVEQPEDAQLNEAWMPSGELIDGLRAGYTSTYYEHHYQEPTFTFMFEDKELYCNHVSTNYSEREDGYLNRVKEWLVTLGADAAAVAAWSGRLGYERGY